MKKILTEAFSVNLILLMMLAVLGVYSQKSVNAFSDGRQAIYKADTQEKTVSLMINVYQGNEFLEKYLDILKENGIKATFFVGGCWADKNSTLLKRISDEGHEIGNHGYNHKLHTKLTREQSRSEIMRTNSLIKEITGNNCVLFAPPSGDVNTDVVNDASYCGCETVMWSADTIDWRDQDTQKIYARVERNLEPGAYILTHPTEATVKALPDIILLIRSQGYSFATVGETLREKI